ncbi:MAG TPA: hypothetical protein PLR06_02255 [Cyclobacteriaceae bacterium]|nr:hypothetical protein [Cyclobacteriaceae bacterium]
MKNISLVTFFSLAGLISCSAQADSTIQQLTMYKTFGGAHYEYQKDTSIYSVSPKQVLMILKNDPLAYAEFKKAKSYNSLGGIIGFAGGVMLIIPVGSAIAGAEPEWGLVAGGAALIITSIPLMKAYKRHAESAVDIYNKKHTAFRPRTEYFLSGLGIRMVIRF